MCFRSAGFGRVVHYFELALKCFDVALSAFACIGSGGWLTTGAQPGAENEREPRENEQSEYDHEYKKTKNECAREHHGTHQYSQELTERARSSPRQGELLELNFHWRYILLFCGVSGLGIVFFEVILEAASV